MKQTMNLSVIFCIGLILALMVSPVQATTITPLCQAGIPFDGLKYAQQTPESDPMVFQCYWDGTGGVYISGDPSAITGVYADDGFTIEVQPAGATFTTGAPGYGGLHPALDLTGGMTPGVNTFTLVVHNWQGFTISYGSSTGYFVDQTPYIVQTSDYPPPQPVQEFPSIFPSVIMIIGFLGAVILVQKMKED